MSSALDRIPIQWRLAGTSAVLTFVILFAFAITIGALTENRILSDFEHQTASAAQRFADQVTLDEDPFVGLEISPSPFQYARSSGGGMRFLIPGVPQPYDQTTGMPSDIPTDILDHSFVSHGYLVETRDIHAPTPSLPFGLIMQYARSESDVNATIARVRFFLLLGVLGGSGLALVAGLLIARRAMRPVTALTAVAQRIAETGDPDERVPVSAAGDEVSVLGRTLDEMLTSLAESRAETEATLQRQRRFVADASHELRTPLTSVLANLELLADVLDGPQGEAASSALRSSQRMRRLVADLLLLARADSRRVVAHEPIDLGQVAIEAAAELGAQATEHELSLDTDTVIVEGARDDLHRMVLNLVENALRHTPPGSHVTVTVRQRGEHAVLTVSDDGPGVDPDLRDEIFDRFVRGAGDRGGSFGLGLSIVRVVAEQHGGTATLAAAGPTPGATFVVTLPAHRGAPTHSPPSPVGARA